jgi:non-homologous end joining protein Ku
MEKPNCKRPTKTSTTPAHVGKAKPAARAAWAGFLRLGALVCPARAFSATSTGADIELHLVHRDCGERIRCPRQCPVHGAIDSAEIVKAIEVSPGQHLLPDESDLQKLNPPKDEELHLVRFVAADEFDWRSACKSDPLRERNRRVNRTHRIGP